MASDESLRLFTRLIREKHSNLNNIASQLMQALPTEDAAGKRALAKSTNEAARDLRSILANGDAPPWLSDSISLTTAYLSNSLAPGGFLISFLNPFNAMQTHSWSFDKQSVGGFDFDAIFSHFRKETRLQELFDSAIKILEDIETSGEIDSRSMLNALEKLIATLKKNIGGSFFSMNSAWQFLVNFLRNYLFAELALLPGLGVLAAALDRTVDEIDTEMFKVAQSVEAEMRSQVESGVKALAGKVNFRFTPYGQTGLISDHGCPGSEISALA